MKVLVPHSFNSFHGLTRSKQRSVRTRLLFSRGTNSEGSVRKPSSEEERLMLEKFKDKVSKAFDMGLHDANLNPCPF